MSMPLDPPEDMDGADEATPDLTEQRSDDLSIGEVVLNIEQLSEKVKEYQAAAVKASDNGDPETLSKTLLRLARVNSALGKNAAYVSYLARNADRAARRFRAERTLTLAANQAVNKSEMQAELDAKDKFSNASEGQLIADQASDLCYRTDTFMKMAQSRLSLIKGDIRNG